ncbi:uncharacterized protein N0V89_000521 [Didymosphaeria variabile]|uniref:Uncharacterized protein n=1 Tax=Didymosphaeria variabile TaxID=1932322 RepID=A0A9W8XUF3_9PLEO|nr:uncharacterized protein N0V89_000521 [Didymosphaeria variabile]KAJ4359962.1 hypothetical protein N0V89_000521 [Didymosphaeria variabile]
MGLADRIARKLARKRPSGRLSRLEKTAYRRAQSLESNHASIAAIWSEFGVAPPPGALRRRPDSPIPATFYDHSTRKIKKSRTRHRTTGRGAYLTPGQHKGERIVPFNPARSIQNQIDGEQPELVSNSELRGTEINVARSTDAYLSTEAEEFHAQLAARVQDDEDLEYMPTNRDVPAPAQNDHREQAGHGQQSLDFRPQRCINIATINRNPAKLGQSNAMRKQLAKMDKAADEYDDKENIREAALTELSPSTLQSEESAARKTDQAGFIDARRSDINHHTRLLTVTEFMMERGLPQTLDSLRKIPETHSIQPLQLSNIHDNVLHNDVTDFLFNACEMTESLVHQVRSTDYTFADDTSRITAESLDLPTAHDALRYCSQLFQEAEGSLYDHSQYHVLHSITIKMNQELVRGEFYDLAGAYECSIPQYNIHMPVTQIFEFLEWSKEYRTGVLFNVSRLHSEPGIRDKLWHRILHAAPHVCRSKEILLVLLLAPKEDLVEEVRSFFYVDTEWYNRTKNNCLRDFCDVSGMSIGRVEELFNATTNEFH